MHLHIEFGCRGAFIQCTVHAPFTELALPPFGLSNLFLGNYTYTFTFGVPILNSKQIYVITPKI